MYKFNLKTIFNCTCILYVEPEYEAQEKLLMCTIKLKQIIHS